MIRRSVLLLAIVAALTLAPSGMRAAPPSPSLQPALGPGATDAADDATPAPEPKPASTTTAVAPATTPAAVPVASEGLPHDPPPPGTEQPAPAFTPGAAVAGGASPGHDGGQVAPSTRERSEVDASPAAAIGNTEGELDPDIVMMLAIIVSVATIALLGTGWMLAARQRDDEPPPVVAPSWRRPVEEPKTATPDPAIRPPRGRRFARLQPGHDPVLAAMGLDEDDDSASPQRDAARGPSPKRRPGRGG